MTKLTDAFPGETNPSFLKTDGSFPNDSIVDSGFGCSSTENSVGPFFPLRVTGAISSLKCPFSLAVRI